MKALGELGSVRRWKKLGCRIMRPTAAVLILLAFFSAAALTCIFARGWEKTAFAYVTYPISAYTLAAAVLRGVAPAKRGRDLCRNSEFVSRFRTDVALRAKMSLCVPLFFSLYKGALGIYYRSPWFGSLAFYYLVLTGMRFLLLRHVRWREDDALEGWKKYRFCGYALLVLTAALAAVSLHAIYGGQAIRYPGHLIYAAAGYAFYNLAMAIRGFVGHHRVTDPVYAAGKALSLATAFVSMFFLQTSMFAAFGDGSQWQERMNLATGGCVFCLIISIAVLMIWNSGQKILRCKSEYP